MSRAKTSKAVDADPTEADSPPDENYREPNGASSGKRRVRTGRPTKDRSLIIRATYESTEELEWLLNRLAEKLREKKFDLVYRLLEAGIERYDCMNEMKRFYSETIRESVRAA